MKNKIYKHKTTGQKVKVEDDTKSIITYKTLNGGLTLAVANTRFFKIFELVSEDENQT